MRKKALQLAAWLTLATEIIGGLLMLGIIVINLLQVFYRYVLFDPLGWTEEAMRYSVAWMTFLVAGAVLFRSEQLSIDVFGRMLPPALRRAQSIFILLAICSFCIVLVVYGWPLAMRNLNQVSPSARIPMIVPYISVVAGGVLIFVKAVCLMIADPDRVHANLGVEVEAGE